MEVEIEVGLEVHGIKAGRRDSFGGLKGYLLHTGRNKTFIAGGADHRSVTKNDSGRTWTRMTKKAV